MKVLAAVLLPILLVACASEPVPEPQPEPPVPTPQPEPAPVKPPEPQPEPAQPEPAQPDSFAVTQEVYTKTFDEIGQVIAQLNTVIRKGDYATWLTYLTNDYATETSKPEYLEKWKDDPVLMRRSVVLQSLEDFFKYLVVPRRANVRLDDIEFVDDDKVYAYTVLKGQKYLLYYLVRTEDGWKIEFY